ncbi:unnamed protein product [Clonostachys rhizophaga]|uniref:Mitochondrial chaperone BCS1 n=1 Tax=Clonostachys rhizophaga TaxID=160324 RepID=A0A9N9VYE0_9HYPO|nr:unnamed protein product [Clonostachys rhizophaga]
MLSGVLATDFNIFTYAALAMGLFGFVQSYMNRLLSSIEPYFSATIHINNDNNEAHGMLSDWLSKRGFEKSARASLVSVKNIRKPGDIIKMGKKILKFQPWEGSFSFWYRGHLITYNSSIDVARCQITECLDEEVKLTSLGWSTDILKQLMNECMQEYLETFRDKIAIFENRGSYWRKVDEKDVRPMSTVILNQSTKELLLEDFRSFLSEDTQLWYAQRALPYRRGYLLYGPPGTGKSSLSFSIAGEFDLDIYVVNIPDCTDRYLRDLFEDLPRTCVVLLEDIDAVGMSRESDADEDSDSNPKDESSRRGRVQLHRKTSEATLSGLLNVLDGVTSQDGRIVIMTTNHREMLDEALIRPGRIDRQVLLPLADAEVIGQLFMFLFGPVQGKRDDKVGVKKRKEEKAKSDTALKSQARKFASIVPASTFSQAEIISYLFLHKDDPDGALAKCKEWVDVKISEKRLPEKR